MHIRVLGAGLAGCEAALYLAGRGYAVELWEQKPRMMDITCHREVCRSRTAR